MVLVVLVVLMLFMLAVLGMSAVSPVLEVLLVLVAHAVSTVPSVLVVLLILFVLLAVLVELVVDRPREAAPSSSSSDAAGTAFVSSSMAASPATHPHLLAWLPSLNRLPRFLLKMTSSLASALALADTNLPAMEEEEAEVEAGVEVELLDEADVAPHIWAGEVQTRGAAAGPVAEGEKANGHSRGDEGLGGAERMNSARRFCFELLITLFLRVTPTSPSRVPSIPCSLSLHTPPSQAPPSSSSSSMKGISPSDSTSWQLRRGVASWRGEDARSWCSGASVRGLRARLLATA